MKLPRRLFLHLAADSAALAILSRIARAEGYRPLRSNSDPLLRQRLGHPDPSRDRAKPDSHDVVRLVLTPSDMPLIAPEKLRPLVFKVALNISN
jgi:hypothetical protein